MTSLDAFYQSMPQAAELDNRRDLKEMMLVVDEKVIYDLFSQIAELSTKEEDDSI